MNNSEKIYKKLSKTYTDEEIVESFFFNETLSEEEQKAVNEEFRKLRLARLKQMTPQQILLGNLMQMKILMQDYFKTSKYDPAFSFANQLKHYIKLIGINSKTFSADIGIHPTKLSRIIHEKESPNIELMYRLEKHSDGEFPAFYWWRLHARKLEYLIKTDLEKKLQESSKVSNPLNLSA